MKKLKVIKIGGNIVDNSEKLQKFLIDFAAVEGAKILVHGGGKVATAISRGLGIEAQMIEGRRVTDVETLKIVTMVYAGLINKSIVASLQSIGCNSIGLCGADGGLIVSQKRKPEPIDYGFVGDPIQVNLNTVNALIGNGLIPIVAPITIDLQGQLLNTNADTVAQALATGLSQEYELELIYCFEKRGVLSDIEDENSIIDTITPDLYADLRQQGIVAQGMIPKLDNAFAAIAAGVQSVRITSAEELSYGGTTIVGNGY